VIAYAEIRALRAEWGLRDDVIEKDYVLGWMLAAIAAEPTLKDAWVFKGGTALRKCYFETYRLSEDLDFAVVRGGPEEPADLLPIFGRIRDWLLDRSGLELLLDDGSFRRGANSRGRPTTQGKIAYRGPRPNPQPPKVKIDITSDEVVVLPPTQRGILHPYTDATGGVIGSAACYAFPELLAEKVRALAERCRPRDLYDVVHLHRHPDLAQKSGEVRAILDRKCAHAAIAVPDFAVLEASPFRGEIKQEWGNMLAHQLPHLPPFEDFWSALGEVFAWLAGGVVTPLPVYPARDADTAWTMPPSMSAWRVPFPLEMIRFAGANRLKVEIDYRAEDGRWGLRVVEPYSLRRTRDGNLVLFVVNDRGQLRSYRLDRIRGVRPTNQPFAPRYVLEL
jgi:predicted nucleotidyltransferase component of viral defense system